MKKNLLFSIVTSLLFCSMISNAQTHKCATMKILEKRIAKDPSIKVRMEQAEIQTQKRIVALKQSKGLRQVIIIPVVVHVLWNDPIENISDAQIQSQIDILNEDFRLMNSDSLDSSHPFWSFTADTEIEFCIASRDPNGNTTTGIIRTYTDSISFTGDGYEKHTSSGGKDNWDPTKYLNVWVCNLDGSTLGYAAFPSDLATTPDEDGIVIRYEAFGDMGTAGTGEFTDNGFGRTATHEVGHWLNLRHIWGDNEPNCGDDFVADTEPADSANYGSPTFPVDPLDSCGQGPDGEMYMNYMDYCDDIELVMFTQGQADRMQSALNGERVELLTSLGCGTPNNMVENSFETSVSISPNPNKGIFVINFSNANSKNITINVVNLLGETIKIINTVASNKEQINLSELCNGVYYLQINLGNNIVVKKVIISN